MEFLKKVGGEVEVEVVVLAVVVVPQQAEQPEVPVLHLEAVQVVHVGQVVEADFILTEECMFQMLQTEDVRFYHRVMHWAVI